MTHTYLAANQANWDDRASLHAARDGSGYVVQQFIDDRAALSDVVRFDLPRLGDIAGLRAVHLQCHIGTDTISLSRLGASVTGLDFSGESIAEARKLAADGGDTVAFVQSDVGSALSVLPNAAFDLVYTGVGAICWLPSIREWATVVAGLLAPGGSLFIREAHPILWAMDESITDDLYLRFPYFEHTEPIEWDDAESYVPTTRALTSTKTYEWNHSLGEIITALIESGLRIDLFEEHDSVPWEALPGQMTLRPGGEWALAERAGVAPLSYSLRATKAA